MKAYVESIAATRERIVAIAANDPKLAKVIPIKSSAEYNCPQEEAILIVRDVFQKLPPGINADVWLKGRDYYNHGLTGPSQRADSIFALSHYLFYGDQKASPLPPFNYKICRQNAWQLVG